jgi:hypothetical protein
MASDEPSIAAVPTLVKRVLPYLFGIQDVLRMLDNGFMLLPEHEYYHVATIITLTFPPPPQKESFFIPIPREAIF